MTETLLELQAVEVSYGRAGALDGVNPAVLKGRIVPLFSGNALGKSTIMKIILGLVRPDTGRALLDGKDTTAWPTSCRVASDTVSVPEVCRIFVLTTVEENLLPGTYTWHGRTGIHDDLAAQYDRFPRLGQQWHQTAGTMSDGEQRILTFTWALMSRPRLICMNELVMGLSPRLVDEVLETVTVLSTDLGLAMSMVEQRAELTLSITHHGYVLATGNLVPEGSAGELLDNPHVQEAYLGRTIRNGDDDDNQT